ncbi:MAG TPA: response regulator [Allosphingosinicella sp.]|jgi:two-component system OmpR family response regulator
MHKSQAEPGDLILLVDDDPEIRRLIGDFLVQYGFRVAGAADGEEMDRQIAAEPPALVVLDLMLPGEGGLAICRRLCAGARIPVIMLSALGEETDRIVGLELGADDYLPKPCSPRELLARVRAVLRRGETADLAVSRAYRFAGWQLDPARRELRSPTGVVVALSSGEFGLLTAFLRSPSRVLSRDQLLDHARGPEADSYDRAIDVQVSRLRRKLADHGGADLIVTVRNEGYMFAARPMVR